MSAEQIGRNIAGTLGDVFTGGLFTLTDKGNDVRRTVEGTVGTVYNDAKGIVNKTLDSLTLPLLLIGGAIVVVLVLDASKK